MNNINLDAILNFNGISDNSLRIILDAVYPVGIVIEFVNGFDPNTNMFGQKWEKLPGGYHLLSTNNSSPNMSSTDPSNHIPGEAAQGGLPNIVGQFENNGHHYAGHNHGDYTSGAFRNIVNKGYASNNGAASDGGAYNFDASRCSNRYGTYQGVKQSVIGDHIAAVMWKRTA